MPSLRTKQDGPLIILLGSLIIQPSLTYLGRTTCVKHRSLWDNWGNSTNATHAFTVVWWPSPCAAEPICLDIAFSMKPHRRFCGVPVKWFKETDDMNFQHFECPKEVDHCSPTSVRSHTARHGAPDHSHFFGCGWRAARVALRSAGCGLISGRTWIHALSSYIGKQL